MRRPRSWLAILLRLLLVAGVLAAPTLTQRVQGQGQGQGQEQEALPPFIRGRGLGYGWSIDIQGPSGTFQADGPTWRVELIFQQENSVRSSPYTLWFLGRKPDNFIMLYIDLDHQSGDTFFVHYYNYREGSYRVEQFSGGYDLSGFSTSTSAQAGPSPTFMAGYAPRGEIPDYEGRDFLIDSEYTHLTPEGGRVTYEDELYLAVYPVFYAAVTPSWREVWAIAVEPSSRHVYFLIFYTITPNAWVLDLWSGELRLLPLGQVVITGDLITVSRDARL